MPHNLIKRKIFLFGILASVLFYASLADASDTNGRIDSVYKYAWGENTGWINFGCDNCGVAITDTAVTGYAWSSQFGWINLNPTTSGVLNTAEGTLSGFAWSSSLGWINFTGVTIGATGEFVGYATVDSNSSQINFNCSTGGSCSGSDFKVKTDWRPASVRPGSSGSSPKQPPVSTSPSVSPLAPTTAPAVSPASNLTANVFNYASDFISYLFGGKTPPEPEEVPKIAPFAFSARWNLLSTEAINNFVFAPLPYQLRTLAAKFPELERTFREVGVERFSDVSKLVGVNLNIPDLADVLSTAVKNMSPAEIAEIEKISGVTLNMPGLTGEGGTSEDTGIGKITLIPGLPIAKFSPAAKRNLPEEFVFARGAGELVDLNVILSLGDKGEVAQTMSALPGQSLKLVIKPLSAAKSVTGYIVFKQATPRITQNKIQNTISRASLTASAIFSMEGLVEQTSPGAPLLKPPYSPLSGGNNLPPLIRGGQEGLEGVGGVEQKLVLSSFEYEDPDGDGIYTADVVTPTVPGEYEFITVIDYVDPELGSRKMSMITVVDPEGYVFEKNKGKETRIPSAIVSLYSLDNAAKDYRLWNASDYQQENPQVTDVRGTYSFLVPQGTYYFHVEAPGYKTYQGKAFTVVVGNSVHQNIEMQPAGQWLFGFDWERDWQTLLLIVVLLLVYNLVRNRQRVSAQNAGSNLSIKND
ncbi:carboxypeptidase regulatory-like domain-containing protein [Candidatus Nomurabacteria bacterium]|nr:carboxypeptidase regulatory-like domain-containing protein [Candidatus Nomurabacteria bacterium]